MDSEQESDGDVPKLENQSHHMVMSTQNSEHPKSEDTPPVLFNALEEHSQTAVEPKLRKSKRNKWSNLLKPQKIPRATRVNSFTGDVPKDCKPSRNSTGKDRIFKCNKCPLTNPNASDFMRHYQNHGAGKTFKCRFCDYSGDFLNRVKKHEKIHGEELPDKEPEFQGITHKLDEQFVKHQVSEFSMEWNPNVELSSACGCALSAQPHALGLKPLPTDNQPEEDTGSGVLSEERMAKVSRIHAKPGNLVCNYCDYSALGISEMFFHRCKLHTRAPPIGYYFQVPLHSKKEEQRKSIAETVESVVEGSKCPSSTSSLPSEQDSTIPPKLEVEESGDVEEGYLKCASCPFQTQIPQLMKSHSTGHSRATGYKCPQCSFRVLMYTMLSNHMKVHEGMAIKPPGRVRSSPQKRGSFLNKCPHCPHTSAYNIEKHIQQHDGAGVHKCTSCTFSTDVLGKLNYHKSLHSQSSDSHSPLQKKPLIPAEELKSKPAPRLLPPTSAPIKVARPLKAERTKPCPKCPYVGKRNTDILKHLKHHGKKALFTCQFCDFSSDAIRAVKVHQLIHDQKAVNEKAENGKRTESPVNKRATGVYNFQCRKCPFQTRRVAAAKHHKESHLKKKRFKCLECSFSASTTMEIRSHLRLHPSQSTASSSPAFVKGNNRNKGHLCRKCGIKVASYSRLLLHKQIHHPVPSFPSLKMSTPKWNPKKRNGIDKVHHPELLPAEPEVGSGAGNKITGRQHSYSALKKRHCPHCPYKTPHNTDLRKHMSHHENNHPFTCSLCTFSCNSSLSLTHHSNMHKRAELQAASNGLKAEIVENDNCGPSKEKEPSISVSEEPSPTQYYCCGMCPYTTKHAYDLVAHRKMHQGLRRHRCVQCSYSSLRANALRKHMNLHKDKDQILRAESALTESKKVIRGREFKEKTLRDVSGREVGVLRMENGYRVYTCNFCPYRTSMNSNLMSHYRLHAGSRHHKCPHCTFNTSVQRRLQDHLVVHEETYSLSAPLDCPGQLNSGWFPKIRGPYSRSGTEYRCKHCPHTAQSYTSLWYHLQKHKKPGKFKCPQCSFSSGAIACLRRHEMVHKEDSSTTSQSSTHQEDSKTNQLPPETSEQEGKESIATPEDEDHFLEIALSNMDDTEFVQKIVEKEQKDHANPNFRGYMCFVCGHLEKKYGLFRIHRMLHKNRGSRPYQCPFCSLSSNHPDTLRHHLLREHPEERDVDDTAGSRDRRLRCPSCSFVGRTTERLIEHQSTHLPEFWKRQREEERAKRKARQVKTGIWQKGRWISGGRTLSVREYMNFYCPKCSFQCEHQKNYSKHLEMHGRKDGTFMCSVCDYSCKQLNVVRFHELNHHTSMPFTALFGPDMKKTGAEEEQAPVSSTPISPLSASVSASVRCTLCDFSAEDDTELTSHWDKHVKDSNQAEGQLEKFSFLANFSLFPK